MAISVTLPCIYRFTLSMEEPINSGVNNRNILDTIVIKTPITRRHLYLKKYLLRCCNSFF